MASTAAMAAGAVTSAYTTFDSDKCSHKAGVGDEDYGSWKCPGLGRDGVLLSAGDQRMHVTFGKRSADDLAQEQTFPAFNDVYKGKVEWRLETPPNGKPRPFATILQWNVMTGSDVEKAKGPVSPSGRVLVVTRLGPGGVCQVGYVDVRANPDANTLARQIADEHARDFRCGKDKRVVLGKTDPDLGMPQDEE
jgi:hypothetical protein